ncbi:MAG TPA: hypothetical protein VGJ26_14085 [Pirellulales bacterium]
MSTDLSQEILKQVRKLSPIEQLDLLEEIKRRTQSVAQNRPQVRSILELEGLGQEIWEGIDAQEYVRGERQSWNG